MDSTLTAGAPAPVSRGRGPFPTQFGRLLRHWRAVRNLSQLDLALEADVSARHISFIETGRSQPSREMVLHLADTLGVPLRHRNGLLVAAGYAEIYRQRPLDGPEMAQINRALDFVLHQQEPFPAWAIDRLWNVVRMNRATARLLTAFLGAPVMERLAERGEPANLLHVTLSEDLMRPYLANWEPVARGLLSRLQRAALGADEEDEINAVLARLLELPGLPSRWRIPDLESTPPPFAGVELRKGDLRLRFFTTLIRFGTPQDVTVQELAVECCFPAEAETESRMRELAAGALDSVA